MRKFTIQVCRVISQRRIERIIASRRQTGMRMRWQPGQRMRAFMQAAGLALAILLVFTGTAIADSVEERLQAALDKIESLVTKLALNESLDEQETDALRSDLASVYRELEALKTEISTPPAPAAPPATQQPAPPAGIATPAAPAEAESAADPATPPTTETAPAPPTQQQPVAPEKQWLTYPKAKAVIAPADAKFEGWGEAADINFRWGGYGQIIVEIANDNYKAQWTVDDAYHGSVNVSTQSQPTGDILIQVDDSLGQHEFLLHNGGLGPFMHRVTREADASAPAEPAAEVTETAAVQASAPQTPAAPKAPAGVWYQAYREQVAAGSLAGSEALEWFISQYETGDYESDSLALLCERLRSLEPEVQTALGKLAYTFDGQPRSIEIPDPRTSPVSFVQIMNRILGFTRGGEQYSIELSEPAAAGV